MSKSFISPIRLPQFSLWEKIESKRAPTSFEIEITARCNNNCRHCFINLPAENVLAKDKELSLEEIEEIVDEAVSLGALWCLISGGEPLLRTDFVDIYMCLKKKGLLVSVFTNATLITKEHVNLFRHYPPRDIEVTVYGVTKGTYEGVTRRPGSFAAFMRGLELLLTGGVKVRLKAMALRSNHHELQEIALFCRNRNKDYFRFDPFLLLRFDGNPVRNEEIRSERLSPGEIVALERHDRDRFNALQKECDKLIVSEFTHCTSNHLFRCGTGNTDFSLSFDGLFRLCPPLWHPDCVYDLKRGNLSEAWHNFVPHVRNMKSERSEFLENCRTCSLVNLCRLCPANAYLETGELDLHVPFFCEMAHTRAKALIGERQKV